MNECQLPTILASLKAIAHKMRKRRLCFDIHAGYHSQSLISSLDQFVLKLYDINLFSNLLGHGFTKAINHTAHPRPQSVLSYVQSGPQDQKSVTFLHSVISLNQLLQNSKITAYVFLTFRNRVKIFLSQNILRNA